MSDHRDHEDALFHAEAALRRQEADIAEVLAGVAEANALIERARAELDAEAEESREEREEEERQARSGALGSSRRELQRRLDREETTWAEVMSGRDEHPTAQDYRDEIGALVRKVVEQESDKDPELREGLALMARHTEPGDPAVRLPDWPEPAVPENDGRRPVEPGPGSAPTEPSPGTW